MNSKARFVGIGMLAALPLLVGCQSGSQTGETQQQVATSRQYFESVPELAGASDAVVMGKIRSVEKVTDNGGNGAAADPLWITQFQVMRSTPQLAATIPVAFPDFDKEVDADYPRVDQGKPYVIYLEAVPPKDHPGVGGDEVIYVPRGGAQGIFEVSGDSARSLFPQGIAKAEGGAPEKGEAFTVDQLLGTPLKK